DGWSAGVRAADLDCAGGTATLVAVAAIGDRVADARLEQATLVAAGGAGEAGAAGAAVAAVLGPVAAELGAEADQLGRRDALVLPAGDAADLGRAAHRRAARHLGAVLAVSVRPP